MSGEGYNKKTETYVESGDFPPSMYTFEINDTYGDGICCGQGQGLYTLMFNAEVIADGGNFGETFTKTWGSCDPPPTEPLMKAPSPSPTGCPYPYELNIQNEGNGNISWYIENHTHTNEISAKSGSSMSYPSGSSIDESGCLDLDCHRFIIKDSSGEGLGSGSYSVKVDGQEVVTHNEFTNSQLTLFGTCQNV